MSPPGRPRVPSPYSRPPARRPTEKAFLPGLATIAENAYILFCPTFSRTFFYVKGPAASSKNKTEKKSSLNKSVSRSSIKAA